ncbi:MAG TPA: MerR family transcriptional regulator [Pseudorhodoferax sp.]|nr:MerR family transcriptional regulator [Pseudorhodoferax sp.]
MLKVGELARRTGLTVRTLHHYDEIGLLKPSGRSDSGYRLYSQDDVQRLHSIVGLRQMGLALTDIEALMADRGMAPEHLIATQIRALDQQIAQASELRARLGLLRDRLGADLPPDMGHWLDTLALMNTYGKYFSVAELKHIFQNWNRIEADWLAIKVQVRAAMDRQLPPEAPQVQALAYRWMGLVLHWMDGDMALLERWGHMFRSEPSTHGRNHAPQTDMNAYMEAAIKLRVALLEKNLSHDELGRIGHVPYAEWTALEQRVQQLLDQGVPAAHADALAAAQCWNGLLDRLARNDPVLRGKLLTASAQEPLLRAGSPLSEAARRYLLQAQASPQQKA